MPHGNGSRAKERLNVKQIEKWLKDQRERAAKWRAELGNANAKVPAGQKLPDGGGLYLTFLPSGRASWQVRYAYGGKSCTYSIGLADDFTLAEARAERIRVKGLVEEGLDPVTERRASKAENIVKSEQHLRFSLPTPGSRSRRSSGPRSTTPRAHEHSSETSTRRWASCRLIGSR